MSTPGNYSGSRVAIIAALEQEVSAIIRGWKHRDIEHDGKRLRFYETDGAVLVCGGIGARAARCAAEAAVKRYRPQALVSVGLAGSLSNLKVGEAFVAAQVIDAANGKTYPARAGTNILVTADKVLGVEEKRAFAKRFGADAVDMEAAAVAQVAQQAGLNFFAIKAISDELGFPMPPMDRFVDTAGNFATGRFIFHTVIRPWMWPDVFRLGRNSGRAVKAVVPLVRHLIDNQNSSTNAIESNLAKINR